MPSLLAVRFMMYIFIYFTYVMVFLIAKVSIKLNVGRLLNNELEGFERKWS